ncbi:hypothetical protein [Mechercharimyces sp. CAU 1602]|uniref:hypothetical protein n=1 Tax=Mechercharimyces sp. CAU 1602 TaxID=2973933 RepID=UPI00216152D0|nr:hypothetical protein [Mechercharimyces sp. CAU 1602]MCS1352035.1 hypothetical protein [Mechercharimyces sp. CAU 1602]
MPFYRPYLTRQISWLIVGILVFVGAISWMYWIYKEQSHRQQVLLETHFKEATPYHFENNQLYFTAQKADEKEREYVLDLDAKKLRQNNHENIMIYAADHRRFPLGDTPWLLHQEQKTLKIEHKKEERSHVITRNLQSVWPSPSGQFIIYTTKRGGRVSLYLYNINIKQAFILYNDIRAFNPNHPAFVQWSSDEQSLLLNEHDLYNTENGKKIDSIEGSGATFVPHKNVLTYLQGEKKLRDYAIPMGHKIIWRDLQTNKETTLYTAAKEEWVIDRILWDEEGEAYSFATGKIVNEEPQIDRVHVKDLQLFHYVESEQNLLPTSLNYHTLSNRGTYLSYTMNGVLKLLNLESQQSRVFDVYPYAERSNPDFIYYRASGVWIAQAHEIIRIAEEMEEKVMYHTPLSIQNYYLSENEQNLIVFEQDTDSKIRLRLVNLHAEATEQPPAPQSN